MAKPAKKKAVRKSSGDDSKIWAFVAYLLSLIGFLLVITLKKDDKFAMYHAKQSLVLFIFAALVAIVGSVIPIIGTFVILPLGNVLILILWVQGIVLSLTGKKKPLWLIGMYAEKMKF